MTEITKENHQETYDWLENNVPDCSDYTDYTDCPDYTNYTQVITNLIDFYKDNITKNINSNNIDSNRIKEESNLRNEQNETNKTAYLEKYLYLIIKILFFIVIISLFLYKFSDKIGF